MVADLRARMFADPSVPGFGCWGSELNALLRARVSVGLMAPNRIGLQFVFVAARYRCADDQRVRGKKPLGHGPFTRQDLEGFDTPILL